MRASPVLAVALAAAPAVLAVPAPADPTPGTRGVGTAASAQESPDRRSPGSGPGPTRRGRIDGEKAGGAARRAREGAADGGTAEPTGGPGGPAGPDATDVAVVLVVRPRGVEVGEPIELRVELHHPASVEPVLPGDELDLGRGFAVLDAGPVTTLPAPADGAERVTRAGWTVVALSPTEVLPSFEIPFVAPGGSGEAGDAHGSGGATSAEPAGEGRLFTVLTSETELAVTSVLGETATEPRPAKGFRDGPAAPDGERVPWWLFSALAPLVLFAAAVAVRRRRRRRRVQQAEPGALERFERIEGTAEGDLEAVQQAHYALTALLREATDARIGSGGAARAAETDRDWLAAVRADDRVGRDVVEGLERVFERAEAVKYAGRRPTHWTVEETLRDARGVLEKVADGRART